MRCLRQRDQLARRAVVASAMGHEGDAPPSSRVSGKADRWLGSVDNDTAPGASPWHPYQARHRRWFSPGRFHDLAGAEPCRAIDN
jgi:hypothetical protein